MDIDVEHVLEAASERLERAEKGSACQGRVAIS
jgi:hypothetical protein